MPSTHKTALGGQQIIARPALCNALLLSACASILVWHSTPSHADDPAREQLTNEVIKSVVHSYHMADDSPLLDSMIRAAQHANLEPDINWRDIRKQVADEVTALTLEPGGPMDTSIRGATQAMTVSELTHLVKVMNDPVYQKYQTAMNSPANQQMLMRGMFAYSMQMGSTVNMVLKRNGLKEVH